MRVGAVSRNVYATPTKLLELHRRVDDLPLEEGEKAVFRALLSQEMARCERRQAKLLAKLEAEAEAVSPPELKGATFIGCIGIRLSSDRRIIPS